MSHIAQSFAKSDCGENWEKEGFKIPSVLRRFAQRQNANVQFNVSFFTTMSGYAGGTDWSLALYLNEERCTNCKYNSIYNPFIEWPESKCRRHTINRRWVPVFTWWHGDDQPLLDAFVNYLKTKGAVYLMPVDLKEYLALAGEAKEASNAE